MCLERTRKAPKTYANRKVAWKAVHLREDGNIECEFARQTLPIHETVAPEPEHEHTTTCTYSPKHVGYFSVFLHKHEAIKYCFRFRMILTTVRIPGVDVIGKEPVYINQPGYYKPTLCGLVKTVKVIKVKSYNALKESQGD